MAKNSNKKTGLILIIVLLLAVLGGAYYFWNNNRLAGTNTPGDEVPLIEGTSYCYQHSYKLAGSCGDYLSRTTTSGRGSYEVKQAEGFGGFLQDFNKNWYFEDMKAYIEIIAFKPLDSIDGAKWLVKHGTAPAYNVSIPSSCWNADANILKLRLVGAKINGEGISYGECYDGDNWKKITKTRKGTYPTYTTTGSGIGILPSEINDNNWESSTTPRLRSQSSASGIISESRWWRGGTTLSSAWYEEAMYWKVVDKGISPLSVVCEGEFADSSQRDGKCNNLFDGTTRQVLPKFNIIGSSHWIKAEYETSELGALQLTARIGSSGFDSSANAKGGMPTECLSDDLKLNFHITNQDGYKTEVFCYNYQTNDFVSFLVKDGLPVEFSVRPQIFDNPVIAPTNVVCDNTIFTGDNPKFGSCENLVDTNPYSGVSLQNDNHLSHSIVEATYPTLGKSKVTYDYRYDLQSPIPSSCLTQNLEIQIDTFSFMRSRNLGGGIAWTTTVRCQDSSTGSWKSLLSHDGRPSGIIIRG